MLDWSLGRANTNKRLHVAASRVEQWIVELETNPAATDRAFKQVPGDGRVGQSGDLGVAVRARINVAESTDGTDSHQFRRDVTAVDTFRSLSLLNDLSFRPVGVTELPQNALHFRQSIRGELEVGITVSVSVCTVPRAIWINLDR
jgi:hypothetical protein